MMGLWPPILFSLLTFIVLFAPFLLVLGPAEVVSTAALSLGVYAVLFSILIVHRRERVGERGPDGKPRLGLPNYITLFRGVCLSLCAGALASSQAEARWLGAAFYTTAIIADFLDGYLARRMDRQTALGSILDVEFDAAGVLIASTSLVVRGTTPPWLIAVGLARYLFVAGMFLRRRAGLKNEALVGTLVGRVAAGMLMGYMSVALWPVLPEEHLATGALPFFAAFILVFVRDWLVVSRLLVRGSDRYRRLARITNRLFVSFSLAARAGAALLVGSRLETSGPALRLVLIALMALILLGAYGRLASLAALFILIASGLPLTLVGSTTLIVLLSVFIVGTGPFSIAELERVIFT